MNFFESMKNLPLKTDCVFSNFHFIKGVLMDVTVNSGAILIFHRIIC